MNTNDNSLAVVQDAVTADVIDPVVGAVVGLGLVFLEAIFCGASAAVKEREFAQATRAERLRDAILNGERMTRKEMNQMLGTYDLESPMLSYHTKLERRQVEKAMKRFLWIF